ncbi:glycosyltransferase family 2 protein [Paenibacillus sp. ACRRX]|uniref:glycosyltransferase family 2 protein n=1 Tax=unclassified Paenibacillus TaxID=185978 RepID=UPI001EF56DAA|nr:glycosyltransferase family 2 protein [Paenibacillus sp. UMB4589-SE434]MCG7410365.1 glycosyltransferase family 2 protein [Paenibacillus sp. ACRRX]MDK8181194.1 glycosyltransferase family 2 protein [Paenibacillus sp. UMB4589-SE434]
MISLIIPTIHQVDLVQQCVNSFRATINDLPNEIIVVDDGSPPPVQQALSAWAASEQLRLITRTSNGGFSKTVNEGIAASLGHYVVLANNDIIFEQMGWLSQMLHTMNSSPDIGIVGARLLYPNQTIQHAGVFPSTRGYFDHRYRHQPADYPPALAIEDVNAVTGALMLIRRDVIHTIGLLSDLYFIAYEDVDYCYRARKQGWRVVYCGTASAVHLEGYTRGTTRANKNRYWRHKELEARRLFWATWKGERL